MKKIKIGFVLLAAFLVSFSSVAAEESPLFPKEIIEIQAETCPVMGGKVSKSVFTIFEGKLYYFCCPGCINTLQSEPQKYEEKLKDALTRTLKVSNEDGICPISNLAANKKFFVIDDEANTITFFHDAKSMKKAQQE
jgi:YHS domain-containing protein